MTQPANTPAEQSQQLRDLAAVVKDANSVNDPQQKTIAVALEAHAQIIENRVWNNIITNALEGDTE